MRIDEILNRGDDPVFSFEFFPPKTDDGARNLAAALDELSGMDPTFVSVTYGAGGSLSQRAKTIDIVAGIKADFGLEAMAHFTCVNATTEELRSTLDRMRDAGIVNVLALRGDPPQGQSEWTANDGGLRSRKARRPCSTSPAARTATRSARTPRPGCWPCRAPG